MARATAPDRGDRRPRAARRRIADEHLDAALAALDRVDLAPGPRGRAGRHRPLRDRARPVTTTAPRPRPTSSRPDAPADRRGRAAPAAAPPRRPPDCLAGLQHADGWWKGELETNVTMDAEDLLLRQFLGIRTRRRDRRDGAAGSARSSGPTAPGPTSTTARRPLDHRRGLRRAAAGRRRARTPRTCARAAEFVRGAGGIEATRVFTRIWLALFGLWPWDELPALPPELILLPPWVPLNIYDFGCWARQTVVALTVVGTHRPVRPLPFDLDELRRRRPAAPAPARRSAPGPGGSTLLDRAAAAATSAGRSAGCGRLALRRGRALDRPPPGGRRRLGRHPAAVGLLADRPAPARLPARPPGDAGRPRGPRALHRRPTTTGGALEACQSPVWDTALAVTALADAGVAAGRPGPASGRPSGWWARRSPWPATGRCAGPSSPRAAGPSSSPTTTTPTSTTRPRWCWPCAGSRSPTTRGALERAVAWIVGHAVPRRRLGGLRRRQHPDALPPAALLRLRRGDRPAERRRHRARRRDARRRSAAGARRSSAASPGCSPPRRPTARGSAAGAPTTSTAPGRRCPALVAAGRRPGAPGGRGAPSAGWRRTRTPTAAGARTCAPTRDPRWSAGAPPPPRRPPGPCWPCSPPASTRPGSAVDRGVAFLVEHPARRRHLGRALVHRHRLPRRLLHQLPPLPAGLPAHGPRPLPAGGRGRG